MSKFAKCIEHLVLKYLVVPKIPEIDHSRHTILCIGDSITFGAGVNGKKTMTWEYFLENKLGEDYQVLNYGISGRTLLSTGDYPFVDEKHFVASQEALVDTYIIMLGTNDSKPYNWDESRYARELEEFVNLYRSLPNDPKVVLMTPPTCYIDPKIGKVGFDINGDVVSGAIYDIVSNLAGKYELELIDLNKYTANHEDWFVDGVHPNELGNREIAEYIFERI